MSQVKSEEAVTQRVDGGEEGEGLCCRRRDCNLDIDITVPVSI